MLLNNENKLTEMTQILLALNKYVPADHTEQTFDVDGVIFTEPETKVWRRMIYGDQLTVARVRGAAALRSLHKTKLDRLEGYVAANSDWHTRLCLVTVSSSTLYNFWSVLSQCVQVLQNRFYSAKSPNDKGTLFHLKQVINRTSFGKIPKHNMKAAEDFLEVSLCAHVVSAAKQVMKTVDVLGDCKAVAKAIVEQFVRVSLPSPEQIFCPPTDDSEVSLPSAEQASCPPTDDSVYNYATDFLTLGLLWHGFHDAIRSGDGDRIMIYWKFLTVVFKKEGNFNYAKEGFLLLAQSLLLSPQKIAELKWCRTVNTSGRPGKNVPVDLHIEHLNRRLKGMMRNLGSNITPESVQRISKALGTIETVCSNFEQVTNISASKDYHSMPSFELDLHKLQEQLEAEEVFVEKEQRHHQGFRKHQPLLSSIDWKKMRDWVRELVVKYNAY